MKYLNQALLLLEEEKIICQMMNYFITKANQVNLSTLIHILFIFFLLILNFKYILLFYLHFHQISHTYLILLFLFIFSYYLL